MAECIQPCVEVTIDDLTTGSVDGTGVFDVLMRSAREHLLREHKAGRITGNDFTQAYIATMQNVLQTATQFTLGKDLIGYQIQNLLGQTELTEEQRRLILAQVDLTNKQVEKTDSEIAVLNQKKITEDAQTQGDATTVQGVIGKQIELLGNQADGYIRDAEQKVAKVFMDSFNTRTSVDALLDDDGKEIIDASLTGTDILTVLNKLREGINVPPVIPTPPTP